MFKDSLPFPQNITYWIRLAISSFPKHSCDWFRFPDLEISDGMEYNAECKVSMTSSLNGNLD